MRIQKSIIKTGQVWRCRAKNYCVVVGKKLKDDFWAVHPHNKNKTHRMQEHSFHFYDLVTGDLNVYL